MKVLVNVKIKTEKHHVNTIRIFGTVKNSEVFEKIHET